MSRLDATTRGDGVRFPVLVKPRSSRSKLLAIQEGVLAVALKAPPVDGAANAELIKLLARALGLRRADVEIGTGASSRRKRIDVSGIVVDELRKRVATALQSTPANT